MAYQAAINRIKQLQLGYGQDTTVGRVSAALIEDLEKGRLRKGTLTELDKMGEDELMVNSTAYQTLRAASTNLTGGAVDEGAEA